LFCRTSLKSGTATAVPAVPAAPPMLHLHKAAEVTWSTGVGLSYMHYSQSSTVTAFPLTFRTPLLTSSLWQV